MEELLKSFGGNAALLLALAYLIKIFLSSRMERDADTFRTNLQNTSTQQIEAFRANLQSEANIQLERLKNSLQVAALEHQTRFAKLHDKQFELALQLSKEIEEVPAEVFGYVIHNTKDMDSLGRALNRCGGLYSLIQNNRAVLPQTIIPVLDDFSAKLTRTVTYVSVYFTRFPENGASIQPAHRADRNKVMSDAMSFHDRELPELKRKIQTELRKMLEPANPG